MTTTEPHPREQRVRLEIDGQSAIYKYVDQPWMARSSCAGLDASMFYPGPDDAEELALAQQVCAGCEVRAECLEYALVMNEIHGVWGGVSATERRKMRGRWGT